MAEQPIDAGLAANPPEGAPADAGVTIAADAAQSASIDRDADSGAAPSSSPVQCAAGYAVSGDECVDVDECAVDNGGCDPDARCTQDPTPGAPPHCECNEPLVGDGLRCDQRVVTVSAGSASTCAIRQDGTLWCWGQNSVGQLGLGSARIGDDVWSPEQVGARSDWREISVGVFAACGIASGELYCWGENNSGTLGLGDSGDDSARSAPTRVGTASDWIHVSLGDGFGCGIRGSGSQGSLYCWGDDFGLGVAADVTTPTRVGTDEDWSQIVAGNNHSCGLRAGAAYCFGTDYGGNLGQGELATATRIGTPQRAGTRDDYVMLSVGGQASCGVTTGGELWCWGESRHLPLTSLAGPYYVPTRTGSLSDWRSVSLSMGEEPSCGIRASGAVWCWRGDTTGPSPVLPDRTATAIDAGDDYACGIWDGQLSCFGNNRYGQLGVGDTLPLRRAEPVQVGTDATWSAISAGSGTTCGVKDSRLYCWGRVGPIKHGEPTLVDSQPGWTSVTATGGLNVGLRNNVVMRWGSLATSTVNSQWVTVPESDGSTAEWDLLSAGDSYLTNRCAVARADHRLYCWGDGRYGQLGIGSEGFAQTPQAVADTPGSGLKTWHHVQPGQSRTCGIQSGDLYCWGNDRDGLLGLGREGTGSNVLVPTRVGLDDDWTGLALGAWFACGIRGGELRCWGDGFMLGLGPNAPDAVAPTRVGSFADAAYVSAEGDSACVLRYGGLVQCWGYDSSGNLGLGEASRDQFVNLPTTVPGDWIVIDVGRDHSCGLKSDHTAWCWGGNEYGQLGIGASWSDTPLLVSWP